MKIFYVESWIVATAFLIDFLFGDPKKYHPVIVIGKLIEKIEVFLRNRKLNSRFGGFLLLLSVTKFYGLAGLRFGYAVASSEIIEKIKRYRQPWSISSLVQWIAEEIIRDGYFKKQSYEFIKREKDF